MSKKIIFINSHPIQYFAPLYAYMAKQEMNVEVLFCSDETLKGAMDIEFGVPVKWDVPLLVGYKSTFIKNYAINKGIDKGFWGLMNFGIWKVLSKSEKAILIIPGWQFFSFILAVLAAKLNGHTVCLRIETPMSHKLIKKSFFQFIKNGFLKFMIPKLVHYFLYIGEENKNYIKSFGIKEDRLFFTPYSVDNDRFQADAQKYLPNKELLKNELNIPLNKFVILFSGKYIDKKNPIDLLKATLQSKNKDNMVIIFMGEGQLRNDMEAFVLNKQMNDVQFTGFVNQCEVAKYYAVSNLFVMCSGLGETWGLATNEAMNFGLPVILSNLTGCSSNLVEHGKNGYIFETGNIEQLTNSIDLAFEKFSNKDKIICKRSLEIIRNYSFKTISKNIALVPFKL